MKNIAINGLGRIGKNFLRSVMQDKNALQLLKIVAINIGPGDLNATAHLFKYDTLLGTYAGTVTLDGDILTIDGYSIKLLKELDPALLPWKSLAIDWVVECTGKFTKREGAQKHLQAGAKAVLVSAPCNGDDVTIIPGVNDAAYDPKKHTIVSLGSCTTNALIPMLKVLRDKLGYKNGFMTTVHAYTNNQVLLDVDGHDLRRDRAAALNIIPTTTGATKSVAKVLPDLADKINGCSLRVPIAKVSIVDLAFESNGVVTVDAINNAFKNAAQDGPLKGILGITHEQLVSSDFNNTHYSVVIDGLLTQAQGTMGKVFGWYDNEWGYSVRLKDFLLADCNR